MNISGLMGGMGGMPNLSAMRDKMFQKADANGDSGISLAEFQSAGKKLPIGSGGDNAKSAEAFGKIDTDGNGSLSKDEMSAFGDKMSSQMQSMMLKMQEMMSGGGAGGPFSQRGPDPDALFGKADADGNGGISRNEFDAVGKNNPLSQLLGSHDSEAAFGKIDTDGDGTLSKDEFKAFSAELKEMMQSMTGQEGGMATMLQGMAAYGKGGPDGAANDLVSKLLDMFDNGNAKKKDDDRPAIAA
jgi:Ca2+-binding EF-hand superfamily protein